METAGCGYIDSNTTYCSNGYTYVDTVYPATNTFIVNQIIISNSDAGTDFKIGYGASNGNTFTPEHYVTLASLPVGLQTFNAPADFVAFEIPAGKYIYFYSSTSNGEPTRTTSAGSLGYGAVSGNKMDESSFQFSSYTTRALEVQFRGDSPGWSVADVDNQEPDNVDSINGQSLEDIDKIDGQ